MMIRYTRTAIALHWLIALLIVTAFLMGIWMVNLPGISPAKLRYFSWHKWIGCTVFALAALRLLWRLRHRPPALPSSMPRWQQIAANVLHGALYVLMFAVPFSGYCYTLAAGIPVVYLGLIPLPVFISPDPALKVVLRGVHFWLDMAFLTLVVLHIAAAIKHALIDRDDVLARILPAFKPFRKD